jgi:hypothetical protein
LAELGYTPLRNPDNKEGMWRPNGRKMIIYVRTDLTRKEQFAAATAYVGNAPF